MSENILKFTLNGKEFEEINPEIRFSRMNAMAFVSKIQNEQPEKVEIHFDGNTEAMMFLMELAGEVGYFAEISGDQAIFERV